MSPSLASIPANILLNIIGYHPPKMLLGQRRSRRLLHDWMARQPGCNLDILYADPAILVVNKPPGLLSVPGRTPRSLTHNVHTMMAAWLAQNGDAATRYKQRSSVLDVVNRLRESEISLDELEISPIDNMEVPRSLALRRGKLKWTSHGDTEPLGIHRLDEATSGLLFFGLSYPMQRALALQFQPGGAAQKIYEAVVDCRTAEAALSLRSGDQSPILQHDEGVISTPLRKHNHLPLLQVADDAAGSSGFSGAARECVTKWRVLERGHGAIRLELQPLTGRTHQLRLHCALPPPYGLGCPVIGDSFYGDPALAQFPYLLELLETARKRKEDRRLASLGILGSDDIASDLVEVLIPGDSLGAFPSDPLVQMTASSDQFSTSAELLAKEHAQRTRLLSAAGWDSRMPALDGCTYLPPHSGVRRSHDNMDSAVVAEHAQPDPSSEPYAPRSHTIQPVPRLLLHAREVHIADAFSQADRVFTRAQRVKEGRLYQCSNSGRRNGSGTVHEVDAGCSSPATDASLNNFIDTNAANLRTSGSSSSTGTYNNPAARFAAEAGPYIWSTVAPWTVTDLSSSDPLSPAFARVKAYHASDGTACANTAVSGRVLAEGSEVVADGAPSGAPVSLSKRRIIKEPQPDLQVRFVAFNSTVPF